ASASSAAVTTFSATIPDRACMATKTGAEGAEDKTTLRYGSARRFALFALGHGRLGQPRPLRKSVAAEQNHALPLAARTNVVFVVTSAACAAHRPPARAAAGWARDAFLERFYF